MKHKAFFLDSFRYERGSVVVQVIVVGLVLSAIAGSIISFISHQNSALAGRRIAEEVDNLNATLSMTFSSRSICQINLAAGLFGSSVSAIAANKQVRIQLPPPSNLVLKAGTDYHQLHINQIFFSGPPLQVRESNPDGSYLVEMTIEVKDGSGVRQTTLPFYLIDAGGTLSCFATNFPQPQLAWTPPLKRKSTMEDIICKQWQKRVQNGGAAPGTPDFIYTPVSKTCVYGP